MKKNRMKLFLLCLLALIMCAVIFCACEKKEDVEIINDDEIIKGYPVFDIKGADLTTYVFPDGVLELKFENFVNSTGAVDLVIPESVVDIEDMAFYNSEIESVTFNSNPRLMENLEMRHDIFMKCENLKKVVFPAVANIGPGMFGGCKNLEQVDFVFFGSVEYGGFAGCDKLQNFDFAKCYSVGDGAFNKIIEARLPSAQEIKENAEAVGYYPSDITAEVYAAQSDKYQLTQIRKERSNSRPFRRNEVLKKVTFGEDYTEIATWMFEKCVSLETVIFEGNLLNKINNYAFVFCTNLKNINLVSGLKIIGFGAFLECDSLTQVILPEGLNEIQGNAFCDCKNLKELFLPTSASIFGTGNKFKILMIASPETKIIIGENIYWNSYEKREEHNYA